jgi:hypothetical protein
MSYQVNIKCVRCVKAMCNAPYWRGKLKVVQKYSSCGVGKMPTLEGLEAHPTRES